MRELVETLLAVVLLHQALPTAAEGPPGLDTEDDHGHDSIFSGYRNTTETVGSPIIIHKSAVEHQALPAAVEGAPGLDIEDDLGHDSIFFGYKNMTETVGSPRIIHGSAVDPSLFHPWLARIWIRKKRTYNWVHHCAGTLIKQNWVLTAAHCIRQEPNCDNTFNNLFLQYDYGVALGKYEWTNPKWFITGFDQCYKKSGFLKVYTWTNDIALLKLKPNPSLYLTPIVLPDNGDMKYLGKKGTIVGWGRTKYGDPSPSPTLQMLTGDISLFGNGWCKNKWNYKNRQLCFQSNGNSGACKGDSGGPLFVKGRNGQYVLLGVASYGDPACATYKATIYTRVYSYLGWIHGTIKQHSG